MGSATTSDEVMLVHQQERCDLQQRSSSALVGSEEAAETNWPPRRRDDVTLPRESAMGLLSRVITNMFDLGHTETMHFQNISRVQKKAVESSLAGQ
jgi:hypothetical protein